MSRLSDVIQFYGLLEIHANKYGTRYLGEKKSLDKLPERGVYFFLDSTEIRRESGTGHRIVRVGSHALVLGARSRLRQRLAQHRGTLFGGGHHRSSIFRLLVGQAMIANGLPLVTNSWGVGDQISKSSVRLSLSRAELSLAESVVEKAVTDYLSRLKFIVVEIDDDSGPNSVRGVIERNSIALLSNLGRDPIDAPSNGWLGNLSSRPDIHGSGLWNQRHVNECHSPEFLQKFEKLV